MNKKKEIAILLFLIFVAFAGIIFFKLSSNNQSEELFLVVSYKNSIVFKASISEDTEKTILTDEGENKIKVEDHKAFVYEADCPNQICVHSPKISQVGETISCLPHYLLLEIRKKSDLNE